MMAGRMAMGRRPNSASSRPSTSGSNGRPGSAGSLRPSSAAASRPSSSAGSRPTSSSGKRTESGTLRAPMANGNANGKATANGRGHQTARERMDYRLELKRERKAEKARIKAAKPKIEVDWKMRRLALWMMFAMSYYPRIVLGLGTLMLFISIVLIGVTASTEEDLADSDALIAILFIAGVLFIAVSLFAIRSRRKEKDKRRRLGYDKKTGLYGNQQPLQTNGGVPTISEEVDEPRGHINGIPMKERTIFSEPKPEKPKFTAVKADETGFTNLAVVMEVDQLPGTPYRARRRESIEESLTSFNTSQMFNSSASLRDDPDILVVPPPRRNDTPNAQNTNQNNKSGSGGRVKKSSGKISSESPSHLGNIPEVAVTGASPKPSHKEPPITIIDTDDDNDYHAVNASNRRDYSNEGFDDGDITPDDLV